MFISSTLEIELIHLYCYHFRSKIRVANSAIIFKPEFGLTKSTNQRKAFLIVLSEELLTWFVDIMAY